VAAYVGFVLAHALPFLDASLDGPGLLDCMRRPEGRSARYAPTCLTLALAHWIGADDFDGLQAAIIAQYAGRPSAQGVVRKVAQRLQDLPRSFGTHPRMVVS
jgi:hypothetical protein